MPTRKDNSPENSTETRKQLGTRGEQLVKTHLERLGWRILALNFRCRSGEIDVIAEEDTGEETVLVFIEVKTRRGRSHGTPIEAVDARKQRKIRVTAEAYLAARNAGGAEPSCRFDIAEVSVGRDDLAHIVLRPALFSEG